MPGVVVYTYNPAHGTQRQEDCKFEEPRLHSEFQVSLDHMLRPYLKTNKEKTQARISNEKQ
jgi:hypothetical protein